MESLVDLLESEGHEALAAASLGEARRLIEGREVELVLLDLTLPDGSGLELLDTLPGPPQGPTVVVLTADASVATTVTAVRRGAYDYLVKPFELDVLLHRVENALDHHEALSRAVLGERLKRLESLARPVASLASPPMRRLYDRLAKVAAHDELPILVRGETGTGKEHVCRLIHELSPRSAEPFVAVNCATFERGLLQSELFGHEKGAFTGAGERRRGLFELARRGTLLLDEVAEMSLDIQAAFLRVLETGRFRRLGGGVELKTDTRIVAATHQDLEGRTRDGRFREDLLYRLNAVELRVPTLAERPEDIRTLADHFCARLAEAKSVATYLTDGAHEALAAYRWPGNARELKNVVERTVAIHGPGPIAARDLDLRPREGVVPSRPPARRPSDSGEEPFPTLEELEATHLRRALARSGGNRTHAARLLGIARSTLIRKIERLERSK